MARKKATKATVEGEVEDANDSDGGTDEGEAEAPTQAEEPKPIAGLTPGRMVHTVCDGKLRAAVIAEVEDGVRGVVIACVFEPTLRATPHHPLKLHHAAEPGEGTWAWMART